ncbi:hypothetical protein DFJ73DRAFT_223506 [Zopfochytrium polystomum]|nr:hypothetical protein DFJ73DRAFT_223506 [Zopfochytrium polystomum]
MDTAHAKNSTSPSNGDKEIVVTATSTTAIPAGSTPAADGVAGGYAVVLGEDGKPLSATQLKKRRAKQEKEARKLETQRRVAAEKAAERAARKPNTVDYSAGKYGALPLNQSQERTGRKRTRIEDLSESLVDQVVLVQARIHKQNPWGGMCFLTLR